MLRNTIGRGHGSRNLGPALNRRFRPPNPAVSKTLLKTLILIHTHTHKIKSKRTKYWPFDEQQLRNFDTRFDVADKVPLLFAFGARSGNVLQGSVSQLLDVGKQLRSASWICDHGIADTAW